VILTISMGQRTVTRDMPKLSLRASFEPTTVDIERRTVEITWTTGARVLRRYYEPYFEELSLDPSHVRMGRLQSGAAPLLNTHNSYRLTDVIGVIESATLEKKRGTAVVRFDSGPEGEDAFRKVREGILRNVSVGYTTYRMQKVEGGETTTPVYRAVDWEPAEISIVPIGADAGAVTRSGGESTPCEFIEEDRDMDPADVAPTITPTITPTPAVAQRSAVEIERERVLGIQRVGRALKRPEAEIASAIADGGSLESFRADAQDKFAVAETIQTDRRDPRIEAGEDRRDKWMRGASAWIFQRAAVSGMIGDYARKSGQKIDLDPGEFRGMRLLDLARQSLELSGVRTAGMLPMDLVSAALTTRTPSGVGQTTSDFPLFLENVLYKILLGQYNTTPDTWTRFCKTGTVSDFRASRRYRPGSFGALSPLNELGEFVNRPIPDGARETLTASTKGNIIGLSRQAIINDDMGAFQTLATMFGRSAKLTVELDVYALLALNAGLGPVMGDGIVMFNAAHNNITVGAALTAAALDVDRTAMQIQRDPSLNEILDLTPAVLVIAAGLGGQARVINDSPFDPDNIANKAQNRANIAGKMFDDIVSTGRLTGTRRYLFADPGIAPCIEVAFLDGQMEPFMDMQEGFRSDGVEWKVRLDYGVAGIDWRGAVTNAGA
jgi:hypothetical protein